VSVWAVDIEPKMVEYLTNRAASEKFANVTAGLAGATSPNLPEPMDLILVVDTYHHLPDRPASSRALRALLRPGGRIGSSTSGRTRPKGRRSTSASRQNKSRPK
jgi:SAM-dependent methyltransferase